MKVSTVDCGGGVLVNNGCSEASGTTCSDAGVSVPNVVDLCGVPGYDAAFGSCEWDDVRLVESALAVQDSARLPVTEMFDTACSRCASGVPGRLCSVCDNGENIMMKGFNDSVSKVSAIGFNKDNKKEYFVDGMPRNLVLLSANDYVAEGAAVLFHGDGVVLRLSPQEVQELRDFIGGFSVLKRLAVQDRTYVVKPDANEIAYASTNYFNTKVNVSTQEERILTYLLTGLTLTELKSAISNGSISGIHPEVTSAALSNFERKWGRTPDVVQMALPNREGNVKGYGTQPRVYKFVGDCVEADFVQCEFNDDAELTSGVTSTTIGSAISSLKKVKKLPTFGNAIAAFVSYDCYSGFVHGKLVASVAKPVECVKETVEYYKQHGHLFEEFAADRAIITEGKFRVNNSETIAYLSGQHIRYKAAEPYNHSNGTAHIERVFQKLHRLIRTATNYILQNPNFRYLGFTKREILMLWGELFKWALVVINFTPSPKVPTKTRYQLFHGKVPNVQEIRMLPIFAILLVLRHVPNAASLDGANRSFYQYGLYVGPDSLTPGAIRVAVKVGGTLQIVVSSKYKCVTDGGSINIYPAIQRGLRTLLEGEPTQTRAVVNPAQPELPVPEVPVVPEVPEEVPEVPEVQEVPEVEELQPKEGQVVSEIESRPAVLSMPASVSTAGLRGEVPAAKPKQRSKSARRNELKRVKQKAQKARAFSREYDPSRHSSRDDRAKIRHARVAEEFCIPTPKAVTSVEFAYFTDWSTYYDGNMYFSVIENAFYNVTFEKILPGCIETPIGFRAVTEGVPRTYEKALQDEKWGEAARKEWSTLVETKAMIEVDERVAREAIRNGADLVILFPVYEEKEKEGVKVQKVRLVGDGRTHYNAGNTYSATPSREELLAILHLAAAYDWDIVHLDEIRAFLTAEYKGKEDVYTKLKGSDKYYKVLKALYGLKTSPRDYSVEVTEKLTTLGFKALSISRQLFVFRDESDGSIIIIYDYVDDFVITGCGVEKLMPFIEKFRSVTNTTEPIINPSKLLGMNIVRDRVRRTISVDMMPKIEELAALHNLVSDKCIHVPIAQSGYIVKDDDYVLYKPGCETYLEKDDIAVYMQIVGSLIWLTGVRVDIVFAVTYLAWFTKAPRIHHLNMAKHCVAYLYGSKSVPLVLGGKFPVGVIADSDASLATAPKSRSVLAHGVRLGVNAGVISAKSSASTLVHTSSFEAELDSCSRGMKAVRYIGNLLTELGVVQTKPVLYCDNAAMVNFVHGEGVAKGVRHMELRMWYVRDMYKLNKIDVRWKSGLVISADKLTKLATRIDQSEFRCDVQGLRLLG